MIPSEFFHQDKLHLFFILFDIELKFGPIYSNQESIIRRVCESKLKEIRLGLDGFMVHDLGLVTHINKVRLSSRPYIFS